MQIWCKYISMFIIYVSKGQASYTITKKVDLRDLKLFYPDSHIMHKKYVSSSAISENED